MFLTEFRALVRQERNNCSPWSVRNQETSCSPDTESVQTVLQLRELIVMTDLIRLLPLEKLIISLLLLSVVERKSL